MLSLTIVFALLSLVSFSSAAECPKFVTQNPFDVTKYAGLWYEIYRGDLIFEAGTRCVNATYTLNPDGSVGVWNQAISLVGDYTSIKGSAKAKNASNPSALVVTFDNLLPPGDYNVLTTNYVDYALVYACQSLPIIGKLEYVWMLSRTKALSETVVNELKKVLGDMKADIKIFTKTEQNC